MWVVSVTTSPLRTRRLALPADRVAGKLVVLAIFIRAAPVPFFPILPLLIHDMPFARGTILPPVFPSGTILPPVPRVVFVLTLSILFILLAVLVLVFAIIVIPRINVVPPRHGDEAKNPPCQ